MRTYNTILFLLFACGQWACADIVTLHNGVKMKGLLLVGEDGETTLQVSSDGFVEIDTATVVSVRKQTVKENAALKADWVRQDRQEPEETIVDKKFAEKQRALGLIFYEGEWITPAEYDRKRVLGRLADDMARARAKSGQGGTTVNINPILLLDDAAPGSGYYGRPGGHTVPAANLRINEFSSSGNFIRRSEFVRPSAHDGKTFDPETGLYR